MNQSVGFCRALRPALLPLLLGLALVPVAAPSESRAARLVVPDDYPSPAAALAAGAGTGVDTVLVRAGRYTEVVVSDLPGGNVLAGAVLYSGVYLLAHPNNAAAPIIDVGSGGDRVAIATANDTDVTVDGFDLPAGPRHSIEAFASRLTVRNCSIEAGLQAENCPAVLLNANRISAAAGDAVFVQDSGLVLIGNEVTGAATDAVTWVSAAGEFVAEDNVVHDNGGFGLVISGTGISADIRGNLIFQNLESGVYLTLSSSSAVVEENTVWMNGDVGVRATSGAAITVARNIIGRNQIGITCESAIVLDCNDVWQNTALDYESPCGEHLTDMALDPEFCCTDLSCFTLQGDSPCAAANSGGCGQIGARDVGCGSAPIAGATWGGIKARFRR